jgi:hypothetical protein
VGTRCPAVQPAAAPPQEAKPYLQRVSAPLAVFKTKKKKEEGPMMTLRPTFLVLAHGDATIAAALFPPPITRIASL